MKWLVRKLLGLFRAERATVDADAELDRHNAVLRRADKLLRVATDYEQADKARRDR